MLELKSLDGLFRIKETFVNVFVMFVLSKLLEYFHVGGRPETHVNDFVLKL